ncbi:MAG: hypothetical protein O7D91_14005 [Planctomycetota bacterium]|nr:hypothetical protein [Planctomycetota bacterium]
MNNLARSLLLVVPAGSALIGAAFFMLVQRDGITVIDLVLTSCVGVGGLPAMLCILSTVLVLVNGDHESRIPTLPMLPNPVPRLGVLVPVCREDIEAVARRLSATWHSLCQAEPQLAESTVFCVLSDSPALAERRERRSLQRTAQSEKLPIYYRRRPANINAKCGNVHEFLDSEVGRQFELIVGFDADTVMSGAAISRLVRILGHAVNQDVALIQSTTYVHRPRTMIGLVDAWSRRYTGLAGAVAISRILGGANYFGHNYAARPEALREASRRVLDNPIRSRLPGLCGYVASHDYAEGTVLSEMGHRVLLDDQPNGSYEESPATFPEYLQRETRWLRGSFQHVVGGWVFRGKVAQRLALLFAVHQHLNCGVGMVGLCCTLLLLQRGDAFLGETSFLWCAQQQSVVWLYTAMPLVLLAFVGLHVIIPSLQSMWWNERHPDASSGILSRIGRCVAQLPELAIVLAFGLLVGPVMAGALLLAALRTPFQKVTWHTNRNGSGGYAWCDALIDLWPVWVLGGIVVLVAATQPIQVRPFLMILGVPLLLSPITASAVSSRRSYELIRRMGLFSSVDVDVVNQMRQAQISSCAGVRDGDVQQTPIRSRPKSPEAQHSSISCSTDVLPSPKNGQPRAVTQ